MKNHASDSPIAFNPQQGKIISTEEALEDVVPISWNEEVLSGEKKVELSLSKLDAAEMKLNEVLSKKQGKIISTEEALEDVVPISWSEEVLSGEKKVKLSLGKRY